MDDELRAGKNIRKIRMLHGQGQQDLADRLNVERTTVTKWETGKGNGISESNLKSIASYYMTSTGEMLHVDLPQIESVDADKNAMFTRIEAYFPFVSSKRALKNHTFKKTIRSHKELYDGIRKGNLSGINEIPRFLSMYEKAYQDSRASNESAVNHTALFCLYAAVTEISSYILKIRPAAFSKIYEEKNIDKRNVIPEEILREIEAVATHLSSNAISIDEERKRLHEYLGAMSRPDSYVHLGLFYLTSAYIYNILDYGISPDDNRTRGISQMFTLHWMGNPYARGFLNL